MPVTSALGGRGVVLGSPAGAQASEVASSSPASLGGQRRGDPGALGVDLLALAEPDDQHPAAALAGAGRELLVGALGVGGARRARRAAAGSVLAVVEADRDQVGVDLGELDLTDLDLHGARVYALAHAARGALPVSSR